MVRVLYEHRVSESPDIRRRRTDGQQYAHGVRAVLLCPFFYAITWTDDPGALITFEKWSSRTNFVP